MLSERCLGFSRARRRGIGGSCVRVKRDQDRWFVVQDKCSAVPHHGFGIFRPESGTFLSRNALLEAQGMVCRQRQDPCGFRSSRMPPSIAFGGTPTKGRFEALRPRSEPPLGQDRSTKNLWQLSTVLAPQTISATTLAVCHLESRGQKSDRCHAKGNKAATYKESVRRLQPRRQPFSAPMPL